MSDVFVVREPWRLGEVTVTVAPTAAAPLVSSTRPEIVPVGFCAAAGAATAAITAIATTAFRT